MAIHSEIQIGIRLQKKYIDFLLGKHFGLIFYWSRHENRYRKKSMGCVPFVN